MNQAGVRAAVPTPDLLGHGPQRAAQRRRTRDAADGRKIRHPRAFESFPYNVLVRCDRPLHSVWGLVPRDEKSFTSTQKTCVLRKLTLKKSAKNKFMNCFYCTFTGY